VDETVSCVAVVKTVTAVGKVSTHNVTVNMETQVPLGLHTNYNPTSFTRVRNASVTQSA